MPPDFRDRDVQGNLSVIVNQPISLVCDVVGSPTPVITWYRDGTPVSVVSLIINKVNNKDPNRVFLYIFLFFFFFFDDTLR